MAPTRYKPLDQGEDSSKSSEEFDTTLSGEQERGYLSKKLFLSLAIALISSTIINIVFVFENFNKKDEEGPTKYGKNPFLNQRMSVTKQVPQRVS